MEEASIDLDYCGRNISQSHDFRKITRNIGAIFESTFLWVDASHIPDTTPIWMIQ
jgi:hypothetical protein